MRKRNGERTTGRNDGKRGRKALKKNENGNREGKEMGG
jgi:hypothetical protein